MPEHQFNTSVYGSSYLSHEGNSKKSFCYDHCNVNPCAPLQCDSIRKAFSTSLYFRFSEYNAHTNHRTTLYAKKTQKSEWKEVWQLSIPVTNRHDMNTWYTHFVANDTKNVQEVDWVKYHMCPFAAGGKFRCSTLPDVPLYLKSA